MRHSDYLPDSSLFTHQQLPVISALTDRSSKVPQTHNVHHTYISLARYLKLEDRQYINKLILSIQI